MRRDLTEDNFCTARGRNDFADVVLALLSTVIMLRLWTDTNCVELDIYHPGRGSEYDISGGGNFSLQFRVTYEAMSTADLQNELPVVGPVYANDDEG